MTSSPVLDSVRWGHAVLGPSAVAGLGINPAPAIAADQGVGLARALQTGRPGPRRPSVRAAFVVSGVVPIFWRVSFQALGHPRSRSIPKRPTATRETLTPRPDPCSMCHQE